MFLLIGTVLALIFFTGILAYFFIVNIREGNWFVVIFSIVCLLSIICLLIGRSEV